MRKVSCGLISIILTDCETSADDERVFLIDQGLQFRFGTLDGDATCSWKDLSGEEGDRWEFVSSKVCARLRQLRLYLLTKDLQSVPKATNSLFELTLLHCMFERVHTILFCQVPY